MTTVYDEPFLYGSCSARTQLQPKMFLHCIGSQDSSCCIRPFRRRESLSHGSPTHPDSGVGSVEDMWERRFRSRLQPVLLVILGVRRRIDHVESIRVARFGAGVAPRLVKHAAMDKNQVAYPSNWCVNPTFTRICACTYQVRRPRGCTFLQDSWGLFQAG